LNGRGTYQPSGAVARPIAANHVAHGVDAHGHAGFAHPLRDEVGRLAVPGPEIEPGQAAGLVAHGGQFGQPGGNCLAEYAVVCGLRCAHDCSRSRALMAASTGLVNLVFCPRHRGVWTLEDGAAPLPWCALPGSWCGEACLFRKTDCAFFRITRRSFV